MISQTPLNAPVSAFIPAKGGPTISVTPAGGPTMGSK